MKSQRQSRADSDNSYYNFGFKIELDDGRRGSNQEQQFDDFGFGQDRNQQRRSRQKSHTQNSNNKMNSSLSKVQNNNKQQSSINILKRAATNQPLVLKKINSQASDKLPKTNKQNVIQDIKQFNSKDLPNLQTTASIQDQIKMYNQKSQVLEYESVKLKDKHIQFLRAHQKIDFRIEQTSLQIIQFNNKISQSLAYQQSSQRILQITQAQKVSLIKQFQTPINALEPLSEQEQKLLLQLAQIDKQFRQLILTHNNLQLSNNQSQKYQIKPNPVEQSIYTQLLDKLNEFNKDPSVTLRNIKMSSLKSRWVIFQNNHIQIGLDYDTSSHESVSCNIHIGNKSNKILELIELKYSSEEELLVGKEIKPNNFIETSKICDSPVFDYLHLNYKVKNQNMIVEHVILPFNWTKFGEFEICTYEQFNKVWKNRSGEIEGQKFPFDTEVVTKLEDYKKYFPNLVEGNQGRNQLVGIFNVERGQYRGTKLYCKIQDFYESHRIVVGKTNNTEQIRDKFINDLQFIFRI